jgi:hypothetical protein
VCANLETHIQNEVMKTICAAQSIPQQSETGHAVPVTDF